LIPTQERSINTGAQYNDQGQVIGQCHVSEWPEGRWVKTILSCAHLDQNPTNNHRATPTECVSQPASALSDSGLILKRLINMSEQPTPSEAQKPQTAWLCFQCGADFRSWTDIPFDERMTFLMARREFQIARLLDDRCPRCDAPLTVAAATKDHHTRRAYRVH
jgi:hypothetical protein